jgi:NADH pyrophosphatase NudC (nudix superfamily)
VGGHVDPGESLMEAAKREMKEELSIDHEPKFLYSYIHSNPYESELVHTCSCIHDGGFSFDKEEIDEARFWSIDEIMNNMEGETLSENFKHEITTYFEKVGRPA